MPDLETQLRRIGEHLDRHYPPVTVEEIVAGRYRPAPARSRLGRRRVLAWGVAALLTVAAAAVLVARFVPGDPPAPIIADLDETPDRAEPAEWPLGVALAGRDGVLIVPFDDPGEALLLESGDADIAWVMPDLRGGLIFQHNMTPRSWPREARGAVLWLPAGATEPQVLVPVAGVGAYPQGDLWPVGVATSSGDASLFVYTLGSGGPLRDEPAPLMTTVIDDGAATRQIATVSRPFSGMHDYPQVLVGGDIVAVIDEGPTEECATVTLLRVADGSPTPATSDCLPGGPFGLRAVSYDGRSLAGIVHPDDARSETVPVTVIDLATGAVLEEGTIEVGPHWHDLGLVSSSGGWIVYQTTAATTEMRLVNADGSEMARIELPLHPRPQPGPVGGSPGVFSFVGEKARGFYHRPFELAPGASLSTAHDADPPADEADDESTDMASEPGAQRTEEPAVERDRPLTAEGILLGALVAILLFQVGLRWRRP